MQFTMLVILLLLIETINNMRHNSCNVNLLLSLISNFIIILKYSLEISFISWRLVACRNHLLINVFF